MPNSSINRDSYNLVAANYAQEHGENLAWQPELDKFVGYLSSPKMVLDLGCGHGDETIYLADKLPSATITGVDFSDAMIALARAKGGRAKFVISDIVAYHPDSKIQGIWARASFHHLSAAELDQLFANISNYADDTPVIAMVNKVGDGEEVEEKQKYGTLLRRYFNYFGSEKVQTLANKYGYNILDQYVKPEGGHQFLVSYLRHK